MHSSRFTKAGDYFRINIAGFPILLIQGKDGTVQAFHNICRHRAYPIVDKKSGSSLVLGAFTLEDEISRSPNFHLQVVNTMVGLTTPKAA
jgi:nitrite reductase/ring-hydroxylating ferredoxin subunit